MFVSCPSFKPGPALIPQTKSDPSHLILTCITFITHIYVYIWWHSLSVIFSITYYKTDRNRCQKHILKCQKWLFVSKIVYGSSGNSVSCHCYTWFLKSHWEAAPSTPASQHELPHSIISTAAPSPFLLLLNNHWKCSFQLHMRKTQDTLQGCEKSAFVQGCFCLFECIWGDMGW